MGYELPKLRKYEDFIEALLEAGFTMGAPGKEGLCCLVPWAWNEVAPYETPVRWHTGERETDPWEWRMRVLEERSDIAYGKIFFKKSGFITREWYPYFLAARHAGKSFEEEYEDGLLSHPAKRIYGVISDNGPLPLQGIKKLAGFGPEDKSKFDRALVELQMKLYITMCGRMNKRSKLGEEYGWSSTVLCRTEEFWGPKVFAQADKLDKQEAVEAIEERVAFLKPDADPKRVRRFILG